MLVTYLDDIVVFLFVTYNSTQKIGYKYFCIFVSPLFTLLALRSCKFDIKLYFKYNNDVRNEQEFKRKEC